MQNLPDYLTDEQKRFWSQENWVNLRYSGQVINILGVFFDEPKRDDHPVCVIYRENDGSVCRECHEVDDNLSITEVRPKKTVAWGKDDFIEHRSCMFRRNNAPSFFYNGVSTINNTGVYFGTWLDFENIDKIIEYSHDGITWLPCTKEVAE